MINRHDLQCEDHGAEHYEAVAEGYFKRTADTQKIETGHAENNSDPDLCSGLLADEYRKYRYDHNVKCSDKTGFCCCRIFYSVLLAEACEKEQGSAYCTGFKVQPAYFFGLLRVVGFGLFLHSLFITEYDKGQEKEGSDIAPAREEGEG